MITSAQNAKIKWVRRLTGDAKARRLEGLFVVEGVRLAEEALRSGWPARLALYDRQISERGRAVLEEFQRGGVEVEEITSELMKSSSDTQNPQGLLVVLEQRQLELPVDLDFVLILDGLRDPGNLGSIMRSAAAAGVQAVLLGPGTVDPYSPKVVRSAMGAHFRLPVRLADWAEIERTTATAHLQLYLAEAQAHLPYTGADLHPPLALIIGGEAEGASPAGKALAATPIAIPMPGGSESLNAASAAAVLMFEVVRQRSGGS